MNSSGTPSQEVLVLAHTRDLVRQLEISSWSQLTKQFATHLWTEGEQPAFQGGVVFATWQSVLAAQRRGEALDGRFGLVVVDEAHHAPSASYRTLLHDLHPNFIVGMTATPWRGDERSPGRHFRSADILDGHSRRHEQGFLADVDYRLLTDGIDWDADCSAIPGRIDVRDLNVLLLMPDRDVAMVDLIAAKMKSLRRRAPLGFAVHRARSAPAAIAGRNGPVAAMLHSRLTREEQF